MKRLREWWQNCWRCRDEETSGKNPQSSERVQEDQVLFIPAWRNEKLNVDEMLKTINKQMWRKIDRKIEVFQRENLKEPESKVYPQIALSPNFYKGEHIVETRRDEYITVTTEKSSQSRRNEYITEVMFQFKKCSETQLASFESVMQEFCKERQPGHEQLTVFGLVAQAGAGKTTYMRNWAKRIMDDNRISPVNDYLSSADSQFKLLLYYNLNTLRFRDASKITTLQELLFKGIFNDTSFAFNWLMDNEDRVVLFFDGLDQTPWTITEECETEIDPAEEANIPTIFYNLLSRNCLSKSSIIISSREFKASALPYRARPQKVYTLTGFTSTDAEYLFNTLVSQEFHENPYEQFSKSSLFENFLTIPMFLTFAACVYKSFRGFLPNSVTALLAKVLELLQYSSNIQERKNIWIIISKLKSLAHEGLKNGVVVFTKEELTSQGLNVKDARDLLLVVPSPNIFSQCLLEGEFTVFFCHQIIQEFLSACFILELPLDLFSQFENHHLHEERWTVVRQFVCGLLFLNSIDEKFVKITDKEDRKKILRKGLVRQLSQNDDDLELFASIYESNDDQLIQSIKKIDLVNIFLTRDAAHMISSLMARTGQLQYVSFQNLDDELLNVMAANLESVKIRVEEIHLSYSLFSVTPFNNFFQNIVSDKIIVHRSTSLNFNLQKTRINWENIRGFKLNGYFSIVFSNHSNSVEICVEKHGIKLCSGIFDKKNEALVYREVSDHCCIIQCQVKSSVWLQPKSVSINIKGVCTQYLQYRDLHDIERWQSVVKVDKIVLDARGTTNEDEESTVRDKITSLVRLFQVQILTIVIPLKRLRRFPLQLEHDLSAIGCKLIVQIVEIIREAADLRRLISTLRESQVRYFQLQLLQKIKIEDLISFIKSCNVTKQLAIISASNVKPTDIEKQKLKDAAESSRINLTFEDVKGKETPSSIPKSKSTQSKNIYSEDGSVSEYQDIATNIRDKQSMDVLIPSETVTATIGKAEKTIEVGGCFVHFEAGSFDEPQEVTIKAEIDPSKWPPGKVAIAPTLCVKAENLRKAATVKLHTWCAFEGSKPDVEVMLYTETENSWAKIETCSINESRFIEFKQHHFCTIAAMIEWFYGIYVIKPFVIYSGWEFAVVLLRDAKLSENTLNKELKSVFGENFTKETFCAFECEQQHKITTSMKCDPETGFQFLPKNPYSLSTKELVGRASASYRRYTLKSQLPAASIDIEIKFQKDEELIRDDGFKWKPENVPRSTQESENSPSNPESDQPLNRRGPDLDENVDEPRSTQDSPLNPESDQPPNRRRPDLDSEDKSCTSASNKDCTSVMKISHPTTEKSRASSSSADTKSHAQVFHITGDPTIVFGDMVKDSSVETITSGTYTKESSDCPSYIGTTVKGGNASARLKSKKDGSKSSDSDSS